MRPLQAPAREDVEKKIPPRNASSEYLYQKDKSVVDNKPGSADWIWLMHFLAQGLTKCGAISECLSSSNEEANSIQCSRRSDADRC